MNEVRRATRAAPGGRRFRGLIQQLDVIIWEADPATWQTTFVSQRAEEILGYPITQWLAEPEFWVKHVHPDDRAQAVAWCQAAIQTGRDHELEYRAVAADGRVVWLRDIIHVVRDSEGRAQKLRGVAVDITARKQAEAALQARARQQAAVAELGQRALAGLDLTTLMDEAVSLVARTLEAEYCKVLELLPEGTVLVLRAGVGWKAGQVGRATVGVGRESQAGYTLLAHEPVTVEDLRAEARFSGPLLLHDHAVVSGMSVIIQGQARPFGVLGAHTTRRRTFTRDDVHFLQAAANVLATAIQRRQAEEALRESERALSTLISNLPGVVYRCRNDRDLTVEYVSEGIFDLTGYRPADFTDGRRVSLGQLVHPDDRERIWNEVQAAVQGRRPYQLVYRIRTADGEEKWVWKQGQGVFAPDGRLLALEGFGIDITECKRAEAERADLLAREQAARAAAEAARQRAAFLAEASAQLAGSLDYEATLATVARLVVAEFADYCLVYLLEAGQLLRRAVVAHADPAKADLVRELERQTPPDPNGAHPIVTALRTGQSQLIPEVPDALLVALARSREHLEILRQLAPRSAVTVPLVARGRTLGVLTFVAAESGRRYGPADLALAEELARRAALSIDNARLHREAREAIRVREEFLARASHELRTPLTVVKGHLALLGKRLASGEPEAAGLVSIGQRHVDRMTRLLTDLLDASRLAAGRLTLEPEPLDLHTVAEEAVAQAGPLAGEKGVALVGEVAGGLTLVGDRLKLEQVLINLLTNAIKHTPAGGTIRVEGRAVGEEVELSVRDDGEGIRPEHLERIFEPFFQVGSATGRQKATGQGAGLGLALVRGIVELHGGRVWAESEGRGRGSAFVVRLPAAASGKGRAA